MVDAPLQASAVRSSPVAEATKNRFRFMEILDVVWAVENRILWADPNLSLSA